MINQVEFDTVVDFLEGPGVRKWQFRDSGIKLINIRNLVESKLDLSNTDKHLDESEVNQKYSHFLLEEGDYVMASSGVTWGKIAEVKKEHLPLCLNTSIIKLKPKGDNLEKRFLWHFIKAGEFRRQIDRLITGSAQPNFGPSHLHKIFIPLPPLPQQKKIAAILDAADAYRQKTKALIAKYDELTQSLFLDMFGDPVANPKGWEVKALSEVCTKITDGEHGTVKRLDSGKLYLMARNVGHDSLELDEVSHISQEDHERIFKRCNPEAGDLLLVCVGATIGRCCLVPSEFDEFSLARSVALIKPNSQFNSLFLLHHFKDLHFQNEIQNSRNTSAQAGLYTGQIKKLKVSVPPLDMQNQFAERVLAIEAQKAQAQESLAKAEDLFNSLLQKAFRGEIA